MGMKPQLRTRRRWWRGRRGRAQGRPHSGAVRSRRALTKMRRNKLERRVEEGPGGRRRYRSTLRMTTLFNRQLQLLEEDVLGGGGSSIGKALHADIVAVQYYPT